MRAEVVSSVYDEVGALAEFEHWFYQRRQNSCRFFARPAPQRFLARIKVEGSRMRMGSTFIAVSIDSLYFHASHFFSAWRLSRDQASQRLAVLFRHALNVPLKNVQRRPAGVLGASYSSRTADREVGYRQRRHVTRTSWLVPDP